MKGTKRSKEDVLNSTDIIKVLDDYININRFVAVNKK